MIRKIGRKWVLFSHAGKILGEHEHEWQARSQEAAVNISKARRAGHRIPKRPAKLRVNHR